MSRRFARLFFFVGVVGLAESALSPMVVAAQDAATEDGGLRVGLALSGGSAKGFAHVGVLEALEQAGVEIHVVAGTSMGSVIGGFYAIGMDAASIRALIASVDWDVTLSDGAPRSRRFLHQRRYDERALVTLPIEGGTVGLPAGASVGANITRLVERVTWPAATVRSFSELPRSFAAVATDIETGDAVTMTEGVLAEVIRASIGIPGAFEPMELDGRLLVDGAVARNLPASDARALGADIVICSDVSDPLVERDELGSLVDVLDQVLTLSMRAATVAQRELCDVLIRPDVEGISGFDFESYEEWFQRGRAAAGLHSATLREIGRVSQASAVPQRSDFLGDSILVARVSIGGGVGERTERLVREELGIGPGDWITAEGLANRLVDLDATGLFGLVRYRLDEVGDAVDLTVHVEERPKNRFGVGLRYDDERRAALLFTLSLHNQLRYGSVTRIDLRVGEETRAAVSFLRRRGVTGRLEAGTSLSWSQGRLGLPGPARSSAGIELTTATASLGLVGARTTQLGAELTTEWSVTEFAGVPEVILGSASAILDHESLDRMDFPRSGLDFNARWEWGVSDLVDGEGFSVFTARARAYVALHRRVTADFGTYVGVARGLDLPLHRTFFLGGAHRSAIFGRTQPLFHGLPSEDRAGTVAQVARAGLRLAVRETLYVRAGVDVGDAADSWTFPVRDPIVGWAITLGAETVVGPVALEWGKATSRSGRLTVSVGRSF